MKYFPKSKLRTKVFKKTVKSHLCKDNISYLKFRNYVNFLAKLYTITRQ